MLAEGRQPGAMRERTATLRDTLRGADDNYVLAQRVIDCGLWRNEYSPKARTVWRWCVAVHALEHAREFRWWSIARSLIMTFASRRRSGHESPSRSGAAVIAGL